ncbi:16S rRNA (guanine(966)-N(2))-methyltransferase RsmD [Neisseria zoodegmatis]|uniref:16S rRNA (Guanine(966)-N(2))-methyltransferase RsmD n=1 Tax=Neisseria zoodegmatis TaxID=326523 RepID=A0AB38DMU0_9NEIS|nr:16S rRNA (guanine(966)-N(2))-methyltransferase RsmD [Neisseria zoodegmatis]OSI09345.1 16S rRNA (guanine(966)-N(2))-methyltransferase RsmD [Neisseria zoodegmatis]SNU78577.1 putative DNA methylase [Neisseria zoodegmatis]
MKHTKHHNQIRIIGGTYRGRRLYFSDADGLRPTPDSVRERLFNWLGQDLTGQAVLDLFGGSGALGVEAASRHARKVVVVENNRKTLANIQNNVRELELAQIETVVSDGLSYLKQGRECFDTVFLDPPFNWQQWPELFELLKGRLNRGAMVYIEAGRLPEIPEWLAVYREGKAGMSKFALLAYEEEPSEL